MADIVILTPAPATRPADVLPALALLRHRVRVLPMQPATILDAPHADVLLLDARRDLAAARSAARLARTVDSPGAVLLILTEGGLSVVDADWGADDILLDSAGPAEVAARLRLAIERRSTPRAPADPEEISAGDLTIDATAYTARLRGRPIDLTYKEFELIKYLAAHPGRVFSRAQLLQEVWGYDYYGGTRTVDVHVRRLRAKLGPEHEHIIGTVRNVGYRFEPPNPRRRAEPAADTRVPPEPGRASRDPDAIGSTR